MGSGICVPQPRWRVFRDLPEAIAKRQELSHDFLTRCAISGIASNYPVPDGDTMQSFLEKRVEEGVRERVLAEADRS